jgi:hypothetical protein
MAMSDINCPYCDAGLDICHDDGFGYDEDRRHEMECWKCRKNFVFTTSIHFYYEAEKADCLNGEPHKLKAASGAVYSGFPDWVCCETCDYESRGKYQPEALAAARAALGTDKDEVK